MNVRIVALMCVVRSAQGAVPVSPPGVSLGRLPAPGVRLSPHRALHVPGGTLLREPITASQAADLARLLKALADPTPATAGLPGRRK